MKKAILAALVITAITVGCRQGDSSIVVTPVESNNVAASTRVAEPSNVPESQETSKATEQIVFTEREPDQTSERVRELIHGYQKKLVEAINAGTFSTVEPYLAPGSRLYIEQKALVDNLFSRKIKERFIDSDIYGYTIEKDRYKVEVTEEIEVDYPDKGPRSYSYQWYYTVEPVEGKLMLSGLEEWSTYKQDMDRRSGAIKAEGYYSEELLRTFPTQLESAINSLDITEIKRLSANETVLAKLKDLITELRRKGSGFSLKASSINEDWGTLTFTQELTYQYTDREGKNQSGSQKLSFQVDEIYEHFQGYAVIGYLMEADKDASPAESGIISNQIFRVHPTMPEYLLRVYGRAESPKRGAYYNAERFELYSTGTGEGGKVLQSESFEPTRSWGGRSLGAIIEDMNFDGYQDIRIQSEVPAGPNIPYLYWLWDPKTSAYVSNSDLESIISPTFDIESKTIQSVTRNAAWSYTEETYQYVNGIPTLIKAIDRDADSTGKVWHVTIKELVDQKMKVTAQYDEPLDN